MKYFTIIVGFLLVLSTLPSAESIDMPQVPGAPGAFPLPPPTPGFPIFTEITTAHNAREQLTIKKVSIPLMLNVQPGEMIPLSTQIKNNDLSAIKNGLTLTISIPQLGIRKKTGPVSLSAKKETTLKLSLEIPQTTKSGIYIARITASTDKFHRTVYRLVKISNIN